MHLADNLQCVANIRWSEGSESLVRGYEDRTSMMTFSFSDSWHSMCGKYLPLMPGIFLKVVFNIRAMNESPICDLRYYWMTDNDTSCRSQKCPWMYVAVVILVRAKRYQFADGKWFGCNQISTYWLQRRESYDCSLIDLDLCCVV